MFITWKGRGWIVAGITVGSLLGFDYGTSLQFHESEYYARHGWPKLCAFWLSAALVQILLPKREEFVPGTTDASMPRSLLRDQDRLFYLQVRYWPLVLFILGVVFYFVRD